MAGSLIELYRQEFTASSSIFVPHALTRDDLFCRVILNGDVRNDLIQDIDLDPLDPLDGFTVSLSGVQTGTIQVMSASAVAINRISAAKLVSVIALTASANIAHTFGAYDNRGGQIFTGATVTVNIDTISANTSASVFSLDFDILTISKSGTYIASFSCSTEPRKRDDRSLLLVTLERDSGSGFFEVPGTRTYANNSSKETGKSTGTCVLPITVTSGDRFRVRAQRIKGRQYVKTIKGASRLSFEFKA